ncbi:MAG: RelA/SpoT AH/RIS domain-containing protein, partial [Pseudomonadota bacterium]
LEVEMEDIARQTGFASVIELFNDVGRGRVSTRDILKAAFPGFDVERPGLSSRTPMDSDHAPLFVSGSDLTPGVVLHFGQCCSPLPGDRIVGISEPERGLVVHTIDCDRLAEFESMAEAWIDLRWTPLAEKEAIGNARVLVSASNKKGVLATLCSGVSQADGNIARITTRERGVDFTELLFDIEVEDVRHLAQILATLRSLAVVDRVERV